MAQQGDAIFVFGMNHRTAEVEVRERFALSPERREVVRDALAQQLSLERHVLISTCNRTELYAIGAAEEPDADVDTRLRELVFPSLEDRYLPYVHRGWDAVFHLFRVSAGLDSMIVGESEILRQVKDAFEDSLERGQPGRILTDLFRQALRVGKRVRTETELGEGSLSVAATAVKLARKVVGQLEGKRALIIGAGETGVLTARHLKAAGVSELVILNRTIERAEAVAADFGARGGGLDRLREELDRAAVVVGCLERPEPIVTPETLRGLRTRTRCLIDISVPRSIAAETAEVAGVFLFDIDDIGTLINRTHRDRLSRVDRAGEIIVEDVHKFLARLSYAEMLPIVSGVQRSFDEIVEEVVDLTAKKGLDGAELSRLLAKRLLGVTLEALKTSNRGRHDTTRIEAAYEAFLRRNGTTP